MSDMNILQPTEIQGERCLSLRCKGDYLNYGLGETERVAGDGNFWCGKTQRIFGPDDQFVAPKPVTVGGPFRASGATSRVNRSTVALFSDRTPTRS